MTSSNDPFSSALFYADIFDFPLTREELWRYAITEKPLTRKMFADYLTNLPGYVAVEKPYYVLQGRETICTVRERRIRESQKKMFLAKKAAQLIALFPAVHFVGVSGGVALYNANKEDDIDLFIIVEKNTVWMSRLFVTSILDIFGMRRKRNDDSSSDKICVNMFLDKQELALPKDRQDLYTAHEIVQVMPLINKHHTYRAFLSANEWVSQFLPNGISDGLKEMIPPTRELPIFITNTIFESFAKRLQLWYMKKHRTREEISDTMLAFHPIDYRARTMKAYAERVKRYEKI